MLIENEFTVPTPVDELWAYLLDVERIAPCMPGAELTETVDERTWKGRVSVKFGPVGLSFAGTVDMTERDDDAHRAVLHAKGMEQKGKGAANATVTSWLEPAGPGETTVKMTADISLTGTAAQLSRGLMPEISRTLTQRFADCLEERLRDHAAASGATDDAATSGDVAAAATSGDADDAAAPDAGEHRTTTPAIAERGTAPSPSKPVSGLGLGLAAIWRLLGHLMRRLLGGGSTRT